MQRALGELVPHMVCGESAQPGGWPGLCDLVRVKGGGYRETIKLITYNGILLGPNQIVTIVLSRYELVIQLPRQIWQTASFY